MLEIAAWIEIIWRGTVKLKDSNFFNYKRHREYSEKKYCLPWKNKKKENPYVQGKTCRKYDKKDTLEFVKLHAEYNVSVSKGGNIKKFSVFSEMWKWILDLKILQYLILKTPTLILLRILKKSLEAWNIFLHHTRCIPIKF